MHFVYIEEAVNVLLLLHLLENTQPLCPSRCPYFLCGCLGVFNIFCADSCSNKPAVLFYYEAMVSKCLKLLAASTVQWCAFQNSQNASFVKPEHRDCYINVKELCDIAGDVKEMFVKSFLV